MAALDDLLSRIDDAALRDGLRREIAPLRGERELGLVFERHLPEKVRLPGLPIRRGSRVEINADPESPTWHVVKVAGGNATLLREASDGTAARVELPAKNLVIVREFDDPLYPGFRSVGRIDRGGDKPFHVVVNAENYHALETLVYTCEAQADAIYIDPPYNSGARDWKYNNDYVDGGDQYRHSKWLAFMERRLRLAKRLLRPDGVLVVTIDEKEFLRLGLLLEQTFPGAEIQMVTIVINPNGVARGREMARVEEYAFFLFFGEAKPGLVADSLLDTENITGAKRSGVRWEWLMRGGSNSRRVDRPNLFYPVFIDPRNRTIADVGQPIPLSAPSESIPDRAGLVTVWPIRTSGEEANWRTSAEYLRELLDAGYARVGAYDARNGRWALLYLGKAQIRRIETGDIQIVGRRTDGSVELAGDTTQKRTPKTVWNRPSHKAGEYGSTLLKRFIGARAFPFPKSLYAVEDTLRILVGDNPEALVIDFFAGSGTTTHALMRLNRQDGGRRRSVIVTNNDVSEDEAEALAARGHHPGDPEWEALGIFEYVTKPRIEAAVTGRRPDGELVEGGYKFVDEFPMAEGFEENVEFFKLTYEDPDHVRLGAAFTAIAPLLWVMAGSSGPRVDKMEGPWALPPGGRYGILFDNDAWPEFAAAVKGAPDLTHAFVVTDSDAVFQQVVAELPDTAQPVRLYESYLRSFAINTGVER